MFPEEIDPEKMKKAMESIGKIAEYITALEDVLPPIEIIPILTLKDEKHKGKEYVAILIERKPKNETSRST